jgi:diguanylate cyclase (GGDEF)-like protein
VDVFLRIDINLMAAVLLSFVVFIAGKRLDRQDFINKSYLTVSKIIILQLLLEAGTCIINKRPELWLIPFSDIFHICLFVTGPLLSFYWFIFIRGMVTKASPVKSRYNLLLSIPVFINAIFTLLSLRYDLIFYITANNVYHRGPFFVVFATVIYFYLLLGLILTLKHRRKIVRQEFLPLSVLAVLPLIGGVAQTLFYGALLMWSSAAFSLIIVYIFLHDRMLQLDYLTGAWNRQTFVHFISQLIKPSDSSGHGMIYIDVDDLKHVNDEYGHAEGDQALKTAINIVRGAIRKNDVIARLGGDEFAVVLSSTDCTPEMLDHTVQRIETAFADYNSQSGKPYELRCSLGADIYKPESLSFEAFMDGIDAMMYENKKKNKPDGLQ